MNILLSSHKRVDLQMIGLLLVSALFGAFGGLLAYWAGVCLGAATFHWSLPSSLVFLTVVGHFMGRSYSCCRTANITSAWKSCITKLILGLLRVQP